MKYIFFATFLLAYGFSYAQTQHPKKIVMVVFENTGYSNTIKQPYFAKFARQGTLLTNFRAITHPSQPNYIAMVAGSTLNVKDNSNHDLAGMSLADLLEDSGKTWKVYADGFPGNCYKGAFNQAYARKHNPFMSFKNITTNPQRCANIVDMTTFDSDFKNQKLADFTMVIPDQNNDGHDTGVAYADKWFEKTFDHLIQDKNAMKDVMVIATFDEDDGTEKNRIYTAMVGPQVEKGKVVSAKYDLYNLLRTIEVTFKLGHMGRNDAKREPIQDYLSNSSTGEFPKSQLSSN